MDFSTLELNELKMTLINTVSAWMIQEPRFDNEKDKRGYQLLSLIKHVAQFDPEFILKVAIFVRDDLNIRSTANFLLAAACSIESCTPFIKKYFKATIRLPSDWLDVAALYQKLPETHLSGRALPTCLRKAMIHKFPDFDAYQLGKYNKTGKAKRQAKKAKEKAEKSKQMVNPPRKGLTIKQMIRQLHISDPAEHVMCIIGKKYPLTEEEFRHSQLPGFFDSSRVGKRMKLPVPETWETLVSAKGNKAATWEELIDHRKLPFMAMLRNLRNLILTGISPSHHRWVINKLTNEVSVASSRQFPFRFFSAYEAVKIDIEQLKKDIEEAKKKSTDKGKKLSLNARGRGSFERGRGRGSNERGRGSNERGRGRGRGSNERGRGSSERGRGRGGSSPSERPVYKKKVIIPSVMPTKELIQQYRDALDVSVKYATIHNVKPIRGSTAVFCCLSQSMNSNCSSATGLGSIRKKTEIGVLLGLMCKYMCEECEFCVYSSPTPSCPSGYMPVELRPGTILQNMATVLENSSSMGLEQEFPFQFFENMISERKKIDNFVILSDMNLVGSAANSDRYSSITDILNKYRKEVNPNLLYVTVNLSSSTGIQSPVDITDEERLTRHPNDVSISGFSDAILKYIAERGDGGQLQYIQHIDVAKGLNFPLPTKGLRLKIPRTTERVKAKKFISFLNVVHQCPFEGCDVSLPHDELQKHKTSCDFRLVGCPNEGCKEKIAVNQVERHQKRCLYAKLHQAQGGKWRVCRVFVSSTFLDMHGERDYLSKYVFPELKERCKKRKVNFFDVDLRWGITQEEAENDKLLNICLNEIDRCRPFFIGLLGERYGYVPKEYSVPFNEPQFEWLRDFPKGRSITELEMRHGALNDTSLSMAHFYLRHPDFISQMPKEYQPLFISQPQEHEKLLQLKKDIQEKAHHRTYSCGWGGIKDGKPVTTDLRDFGRKVLTDLWESICQVFPEQQEEKTPLQIEREFHESFLENKSRTFVGRKKVLADLSKWADSDQPSNPMIVSGKSGDGKSALLAQFARTYSSSRPGVFVLPHFVGSSPRSRDIRFSLYRICQELATKFNIKENIPQEFQALRQLFPTLLEQSSFSCRILLLIDGINEFENINAYGLDWIHSVSSATKILLSTYEDHQSYKALVLKNPEPLLKLEPMPIEERRDLVRSALWEYRKKLDENPSNNQMRSLLRKPEAIKPLYLVLACQELRVFGEFEKVNDFIKNLGTTVPKIFESALERLESDLNKEIITTALTSICVSRTGLLEEEVLSLLGTSTSLPPLQKIERISFDKSLPKPRWAPIFNSLELFLRPLDDGQGILQFFHAQMHNAVHKRYLSLRDKEAKIHRLLGSFFFHQLDPEQNNSWTGSKNVRSVSELVYHSLRGKVFSFLKTILFSLEFLEIKCRSGLTFELVGELFEATQIFSEKNEKEDVRALQDIHHFLSSNAHILSQESHLLFQQALNEPDTSYVCVIANKLKENNKDTWIEWLNKPHSFDPCVLTLAGSTTPFSSSCFSPDSKHLCCGGSDGTIKVFDTQSGSEFLTLIGHSNTVSFCCYSPDGRFILSASYDCTLKIWDSQIGVLVRTFSGHSKRVSCCCWTSTGERIISSGWDCSIKFWDVFTGKEEFSFSGHQKPIECLALSPNDTNLVSASWDGMMKVWNIGTKKCQSTIQGHNKSIRSVEFSPNGRQFVSTSVDCTVRLWGLDGKEINRLEGHSKPVNKCSFSSDGRLLISASDDKTIKVWDALGGRQKDLIQFSHRSEQSPIQCIAATPDDKFVFTGHGDCLVRKWDLISGEEVMSFSSHKRVITCIAVHQTENFILVASGAADGFIALHDGITGNIISYSQAHRDNVSALCFISDKRLLSSSDDFTLRFWDTKKWREIEVLKGHVGPVTCCALDPNSHLIASGSRDKSIRLWDTKANVSMYDEEFDTKGKYCIKVLTGHMDWLNCVSFSSNSKLLVSGSWDFNIKVWNISNCQEVFTLNGHLSAISQCLFTSDDEKIVSSSYDGTLKIWDSVKGLEIVTLSAHNQRVNDFCFLQDTKAICSVSDDCTIRTWDVLAGSVITNLEGHSGSINSCSFSLNEGNPKIISTSEDCTVKIWDPAKAEKLPGHMDSVTCLDIRGNHVVSSSRDSSVCLWQIVQETLISNEEKGFNSQPEEVQTRTNLKKVGVYVEHSRAVNKCCFDRDGRNILSCSDDGKVILRELVGKVLLSLTCHDSVVSTCSLSYDSSQFLSGSWDHTVKLWDSRTKSSVSECTGFFDWVTCTAFSPDETKFVAGSYDSTLKIWDKRAQKLVGTLDGSSSWIQNCSWQHDSLILSCNYEGHITVWDTRTLSYIETFSSHQKRVNNALFLSDSLKEIISVSDDSTVRVHRGDLAPSKFYLKGLGTSLICSSINEPNRHIVTGDSLGNLYLLDTPL